MIDQTKLRDDFIHLFLMSGKNADEFAHFIGISNKTFYRFVKHKLDITRIDALSKIYNYVHDNINKTPRSVDNG